MLLCRASLDAVVAYEMALEQIIADLDDLEERVENLNVDQKTNEDILLNVLKRVDETEKDLRKVRRGRLLTFCWQAQSGMLPLYPLCYLPVMCRPHVVL